VIEASILASLLDRDEIERLLYDEESAAIALRAGAISARVNVGDVIADRAENDLVFDFLDGFNQTVGLVAL